MRRKLTAAAVLAVTVVGLIWLFLPPEVKARVIAYTDIAQVITGPWTFAPTSSVAVPGTTGAGFYFKRDAAVPDSRGVIFETTNGVAGLVATPFGVHHRTTTATVGDGVALALGVYDSAGNQWQPGQIRGVATDVTDGTEDGYLEWWTTAAGTLAGRMRLDQTGLMGPAAGLLPMPSGATITGGSHADATSLNVTAGSSVGFEGAAGNTSIHRETATASLEFTLDGVRGGSVIGGMWQPPPCPADLNLAPPGFCYDAAGARTVLVGVLETYP